MLRKSLFASTALAMFTLSAAPTLAQVQPDVSPDAEVPPAEDGGDIVVTARRRTEVAQDVPIALTALGGEALTRQGAFSIQSVSQQAPTLQYTSSNPRNTALNIRGLGVSFGLANDGLEQGVGFYVDQVYNSRPAAAAFDLLDIERVEVLRGPQGTLFGKNTTAGAVNITTKLPSFSPEGEVEGSIGTHGFVQVKGAISGPIVDDRLAFRLAVGKTYRDGFVRSTQTGRNVNDLDNLAMRGQLLWKPNDALSVRLTGDYALSDGNCCTQVFVGYGATLRSADRQFPAMAAALGYAPPSQNPYDRLADVDAPIKARSALGGVSLIADYDFDHTTLTSVSAWRWWDWQPANDRDYTALDILRQSANPVQQNQYSQELRLASNGKNKLDYTLGAFAFYQKLRGQNVTEWGRDAAYWLLGTQTANGTAIPRNLLDGYITNSDATSTIESYAGFGQLIWRLTDQLTLTPGIRYTFERKRADYAAVVGGLATANSALVNAKLSIFRPQAYQVGFSDDALTGDINLSWQPMRDVHLYASYSRGFKSGGINLAGLPFNSTNNPALNRAIINPEKSDAYEIGVKTQLFDRKLTANFAAFRSDVQDFQASVVDIGPGALRGYLANIENVRSQGIEADLTLAPVGGFSAYLRAAYTDAKYVAFTNAPCPLELIGNTTAQCDLSGKPLPGTSKWALGFGGEYSRNIASAGGKAYFGIDGSYRSAYFADASDSRYLRIPGYALVNLRAGFRADAGWEVFALVRNLLGKNYLNLLTPQSGNSGFISGVPGDPRTFQLTARYSF